MSLRHSAVNLRRRLDSAWQRARFFRDRHGWPALWLHVVRPWRWMPRLFFAPRLSAARGRNLGRDPRSFPFGVNIIGSVQGTKSFAEVARLTAEALRTVDVPYVFNDGDAERDAASDPALSDANPYRFNLVVSGIDPVQDPGWRLGRDYRLGRYTVALHPWEHDEIPDHLRDGLRGYDEIWAPSSFAAEALARASPVPVVRVLHPMRPRPAPSMTRSPLLAGIAEDAVVFLFVFNYLTISYGRKNPEGVVSAFRRAFAPDDAAALVIKGDFASARRELEELRGAVGGRRDIRVLDARLRREELDQLMASADCYVSLHRSEGFGMTMAEAMAFGKPVIATRYSGNLDFTTDENSYLVDCRIVRVAPHHGPRRAGLLWAEPDLDHAATLMRRVYEHREEARRKGERGRQDVERLLSPRAIGRLMKERLLALQGGSDHGTPGEGTG